MNKFFVITWLLFSVCFSSMSLASDYEAEGPHIQVRLLAEHSGLKPGSVQTLAIEMRPDPEWHTYWLNPGDSGEPPAIQWQSSEAITFGDILWPVPAPIPVAHLVNYGYSNAHLLMVPITVPNTLTVGEVVTLTADLTWLVCKEDCIPGSAQLRLSLPVTAELAKSVHADLFEQARKDLPHEVTLQGTLEINRDNIAISFNAPSGYAASPERWTVLPFRGDVIDHAAPQSQVSSEGKISLAIPKSDYFPSKLNQARFLVKQGNKGFYLDVSQANVDESNVENSSRHSSLTLSQLLLLAAMAFVGGLILNIMPCVLPVISIKAMALNQEASSRIQQIAYLVGVLLCFNLFALTVIVLQQSGEQLGWGFHMQSPSVIILLAFLFTFIALILWDVFTVGTTMSDIGETLVTGHSAKSHFFTGLLAVVVASPCTAPFMASALGVAMVSDTLTTLVIFNALAVGFALPMTLLFMSSNIRGWLPKPGAWMQTFKHLLAFPMLATVAWLCWVYAGQQGNQAQFILLVCLVVFAMCGYLLAQLKTLGKIVCGCVMLACVLAPISLYSSTNIDKLAPTSAQAFDPDLLQRLRSKNDIVLVNMTADWCITCKVNEQVALTTQQVKLALDAENVHYMVGDWTNRNQQILEYLQQYDRAGVPLYVVYAGSNKGRVLPQILTPGLVVDALTTAKQELNNVN
ncbi:hypothetical protein DRW07_01390 [Alteromonas sediminis]|uniref:Thiol:disulfide interchange protein DsbD N-terminal domain-containing protein n=1 Tax=Alteromonas sediminis TaxID=2259342 RepID=A0A3N5ZAG3_9ALTE|nr:protein-disulfide reductase DsbD domain-containing protein [Alteromonas sediminis]RPJ68094.1 hypothetical protein DRW07_01390 [Alteromonas sediminis]